jgi:hypothetical protein
MGWVAKNNQSCFAVRPPWLEAPAMDVRLVGQRLFHYELPRYSFRQEKRLFCDGVVGYLDLAGEIGVELLWARAAEVFHFGEKSTSG